MALKKKNVKSIEEHKTKYTKTDIENMADEYNSISEQIKVLNNRKKELSEAIKEGAKELGTKDDKGSYYLNVKGFVVGAQHKQPITILDTAYDFLRKYKDKDGKNLADCIEQVTTYKVDENALSKAVQDERITVEELQKSVYSIGSSYSVSVKKSKEQSEEEMPEVEQKTFKKAARRK